MRKGLEDKVETPEVEGLMSPQGCSGLGLNPRVLHAYLIAVSAGPTEREESKNEVQDTLLVLPVVQVVDLWAPRSKGLCKS